MNQTEASKLGVCTICQTLHVADDTFENARKCADCGEESVYSIVELSDIANDYKTLREELETVYKDLSY